MGKDTDLLMLLIHGVQLSDHSVFFTSDEKSKTARKLWDVKYAKYWGKKSAMQFCRYMLYSKDVFDWETSCIAEVSKNVKVSKYNIHFNNTTVKQVDTVNAREELLVIYGGKDDTTLDSLRFEKFHHKLASSSTAGAPETLNPTSSAASFHSLRVYHQVQCWTGQEDLEPMQRGWEVQKKARCIPSTPTRKLHHQAFLKFSGVDVKVIIGKTNVHAEDIIFSAKNAVIFPVSVVKRL